MNDEEEKYYVCIGMEKYGGGFMQKLGRALGHADSINTAKIKQMWLDDWKKYLEFGLKSEEGKK